jgi:hypothetical protein
MAKRYFTLMLFVLLSVLAFGQINPGQIPGNGNDQGASPGSPYPDSNTAGPGDSGTFYFDAAGNGMQAQLESVTLDPGNSITANGNGTGVSGVNIITDGPVDAGGGWSGAQSGYVSPGENESIGSFIRNQWTPSGAGLKDITAQQWRNAFTPGPAGAIIGPASTLFKLLGLLCPGPVGCGPAAGMGMPEFLEGEALSEAVEAKYLEKFKEPLDFMKIDKLPLKVLQNPGINDAEQMTVSKSLFNYTRAMRLWADTGEAIAEGKSDPASISAQGRLKSFADQEAYHLNRWLVDK